MSDSARQEEQMRLWIRNLDQLVQVCANQELVKRGPAQDRLAVLNRTEAGDGCSLIIGSDGRIRFVGHDADVPDHLRRADRTIEASGCSVIPGLVDAHTHPVWAGDRSFEFDLKARGVSYMDIHQRGGGIHRTVRDTRKATHPELSRLLAQRLWNMLRCGTTLVECKTGYGLDFDSELKQLEVLQANNRSLPPIDRVITFLGAHAVPEEMDAEQAVANVLGIMMRLHEERSDLKVDFVDAFCERGVFNLEQTRRVLLSGRSLLDCHVQLHAEQLSHQGSAVLAAELGARSISHAEHVSKDGIAALAGAKCSVILCPASQQVMRSASPPARSLIEAGVPVALGSDFCPNAYCYSMAHAMHLAVLTNHLSVNEALIAATINAAHALAQEHDYGSLEIGKWGDCLLLSTSSWVHLVYQFGDVRSLIRCVIKKGQVLQFPSQHEPL